jgi:hypothetical protein
MHLLSRYTDKFQRKIKSGDRQQLIDWTSVAIGLERGNEFPFPEKIIPVNLNFSGSRKV